MKGGSSTQYGFTVLETLITLSVTGVLLISAMTYISGKQNYTEFTQAIRALQGDIQQIMNEVGSGYYPNISGINCFIGGGGTIQLNSNPGVDTSGTNRECVYLGRALQFQVDVPAKNIYNAYTIVAKNNQDTMATADPRLIARGPTDPGSFPNEFESKKLRYGLTVSEMYRNNDPSQTISAVAFVSNLGTAAASDGSQQVNIMAIPNTGPATTLAGITQINLNLESATTPADGVQICLDSGGTNQSALLSIGASGRQNGVELQVFSSPGC
jgi:type II secretory pathway pseudopilin PulG